MLSTPATSRAASPAALPLNLVTHYAPFAAVLGAMTFNTVLCFVNTKLGGIGDGYAIICEICIISIVLFLAYPAIDQMRLIVISTVLFYLIGLAAIRAALYGGSIEIKPVRDMLIPIAFFLLGARLTNIRYAERLVAVAAALVVIVGLVEYAFPTQFTHVLDIAKFYVQRGSMHAGQGQQSSDLFVSGMRPEQLGGRKLLPFLGDHRISSIFLEPVSAGNFGIILFMWALVRSLQTRRLYMAVFGAAVVMIILSDSRFGASFCLVITLLALIPVSVTTFIAAILPAAGLIALIVLPDSLSKTHAISNGLIGRIIWSGHILSRLDLPNWFGIKSPDIFTLDSGYSYLLGGIGILGALIFWAMLWSVDSNNWQFKLFRNFIAAYYAALLCISNSPFTIKTASLLWFLAGVLAAAKEPQGLVSPVSGQRDLSTRQSYR
jgi:putative polymerase